MNKLSWLLYVADVLQGMEKLLIFMGVLALLGFCVHAIFYKSNDYPFEGVITGTTKPLFKGLGLSFILLFLAAAIPSKETIYLIAGSEAGEAVVTTEQGKAILNDVQEVIQFQLDTLKGPDQ